jgi:hypothetical protein
MATITTKYSVGDVVYYSGTTTTRKQHPCPDCLGERKWKATSPAGEEYEFGCPRCSTRYMNERDLSLDYTAHVPNVSRMHIGSVQFNSADGSWDHGARYMCDETGVGSGSVYPEDSLHETEEAALAAAEAKAAVANQTSEWVVKLYNKTLEISDYQLGSAMLKLAKDHESRASFMLYNLRDLFAQIEEAGDKEAALEAVEDYRRYYWERDLKELRDSDGTATAAACEDMPVPQDCQARAEGIAQGHSS